MIFRVVAVALLLPLGACQSPETPSQDRNMATSQPSTPAMSAPQSAAQSGMLSNGASEGDTIIAENDRAIAENKRMSQAISAHRAADPARLDRLQSSCEQKLGPASDRESAKRIFDCVEQGW